MGVVPEGVVPTAGVNPKGQGCGQGVIEGRLVAFVAPVMLVGLGLRNILDGQPARFGHIFDYSVVARFISGFQRRRDQAVDDGQADKGQEDEQNWKIFG
jgi:hypothetical protein